MSSGLLLHYRGKERVRAFFNEFHVVRDTILEIGVIFLEGSVLGATFIGTHYVSTILVGLPR